MKRTKRDPSPYKSIQAAMFDMPCCLVVDLRAGAVSQDPFRRLIQPTRSDNRLDFYVMYRREAATYDAEYVKRQTEDLNTTLVFVRAVSSFSVPHLTYAFRPVCSPLSVQPS